ncbi:MAG: DUF2085 domain-containing protein [Thermoplasmata archaeon]
MNFSKMVFVFFLLTFAFAVSIWISPVTMPRHTVVHLWANANMVDYDWFGDGYNNGTTIINTSNMTLFHKVIYWFGDFNCHQRYERSITFHDNQMPLCARCTGIFTAVPLGAAFVFLCTASYSFRDTAVSFLPVKFREKLNKPWRRELFLIALFLICIAPMVLDGGLQLVTSYESNNVKRLITGALAGWFGGYALGVVFLAATTMAASDPGVQVAIISEKFKTLLALSYGKDTVSGKGKKKEKADGKSIEDIAGELKYPVKQTEEIMSQLEKEGYVKKNNTSRFEITKDGYKALAFSLKMAEPRYIFYKGRLPADFDKRYYVRLEDGRLLAKISELRKASGLTEKEFFLKCNNDSLEEEIFFTDSD